MRSAAAGHARLVIHGPLCSIASCPLFASSGKSPAPYSQFLSVSRPNDPTILGTNDGPPDSYHWDFSVCFGQINGNSWSTGRAVEAHRLPTNTAGRSGTSPASASFSPQEVSSALGPITERRSRAVDERSRSAKPMMRS